MEKKDVLNNTNIIVGVDEEHDDKGRGVKEEPLRARAVVPNVVLDEPGLLARGDVRDTEERRECVGADCAPEGVVPDRVVAVEAQVERPLEAAVSRRISLQ